MAVLSLTTNDSLGQNGHNITICECCFNPEFTTQPREMQHEMMTDKHVAVPLFTTVAVQGQQFIMQ